MAVILPSDDELAHYGILGMKWGVRHDRKKTGGSKTTAKAKPKKRAWNQDQIDLDKRQKARIERQLKNVPGALKRAQAHAKENFDKPVSKERWSEAVRRTKLVISDYTDDEELWDDEDSIADEILYQVQWLDRYGKSAGHSGDSGAYLAHYGVLGMKWGVRKEDERQARIDERAKKIYDENPYSKLRGKSKRRVKAEVEDYSRELKRDGVKRSDRKREVNAYRKRAEASARYAEAEKRATKQIASELKKSKGDVDKARVSAGKVFYTTAMIVGAATLPYWAGPAIRGAKAVADTGIINDSASTAVSATRWALSKAKTRFDVSRATTKTVGAAYVDLQQRMYNNVRNDIRNLRRAP